MIHTIQYYVPHEIEDLYQMQKRFKFSGDDVDSVFHIRYPFARFKLIKQYAKGKYYLSIHIDLIKMLGRAEIVDSDFDRVDGQISRMIFELFLDYKAVTNSFLVRVDYRYDVKVTDPLQRKLLFHLYGKLATQYGRLKKHLGKSNKASGEFEPYETSIYHSAKSSGILVYDKEEHLKDTEEMIMPYEEDVVRFEVRLSKPHLDYKKNPDKCSDPRDRTLKSYFKKSVYYKYMYRLLKPIYFKGDFRKFSEAKSIIEKSSLTPHQKKKLDELISQMNYSKASISSPVQKGTVSKPTFKKYLKLLETLNIHPITIPKNMKGSPKRMANPLDEIFTEIEKATKK